MLERVITTRSLIDVAYTKYTLEDVSARAAVRVEYFPPGPTVIAPEGGELAHRTEIARDKKKTTRPCMLEDAE